MLGHRHYRRLMGSDPTFLFSITHRTRPHLGLERQEWLLATFVLVAHYGNTLLEGER